MTEQIQKQLLIMGIMTFSGMTTSLLFSFFQMHIAPHSKIFSRGGFIMLPGVFVVAYFISECLYFSSFGKITVTGIVAFVVGFIWWKKITGSIILDREKEHGEKGESTEGIRKEQSRSRHYRSPGRTKKEKK